MIRGRRGPPMRIFLAIVLLTGCVREVLVPVRQLVMPKCEVPNSFERCKDVCMEKGQRPTDSWEDAAHFECNCAPFDA